MDSCFTIFLAGALYMLHTVMSRAFWNWDLCTVESLCFYLLFLINCITLSVHLIFFVFILQNQFFWCVSKCSNICKVETSRGFSPLYASSCSNNSCYSQQIHNTMKSGATKFKPRNLEMQSISSCFFIETALSKIISQSY